MENIKKSKLIKILIVVATVIGVALSFIFAKSDGYKNWHYRLLYFTLQSNLWIGITAFLYLLPAFNRNEKLKAGLYVCKYIFTVSITVTGIVFCGLLAPFAHKDGYNAFNASSVLLHAVVPILAIIDYFVDVYMVELERKHLFYSILPPLIYFVIASVFSTTAVKALASYVEDELAKAGLEPLHRDVDAKWIALDYGSVIMHVFYKELRDFYQIERLWADGENIKKMIED